MLAITLLQNMGEIPLRIRRDFGQATLDAMIQALFYPFVTEPGLGLQKASWLYDPRITIHHVVDLHSAAAELGQRALVKDGKIRFSC